MVQLRERWDEFPGSYEGQAGDLSAVAARRMKLADELAEDGRLELSHVRRLLDDLTANRFSGELDSWSKRRYDALCQLEQELLRLQT